MVNEKLAIIGKKNKKGLWNLTSKSWVLPPTLTNARISNDNQWLEIKDSLGKAFGFDALRLQSSVVVWDSLSITDPISQLRGFSKGKVSITQGPEFAYGSFYEKVNLLENGFVKCSENGKWGIIRNQKESVLPFIYSEIIPFKTNAGYLFSIQQDQKEGAANEKGLILLPVSLEKVRPAKDLTFIARSESKWGVINQRGIWVVENKYDSIVALVKNKDEADFPLLAWKKGKSAMVNSKGMFLTEFMEGQWRNAGEGCFFLKSKESFSLWNTLGKPSGELRFADVNSFSDGKASVLVDGKWGFINPSGRLVIPARFEDVLPFQNGIGFAKEKGLWGVMKRNGSWLVKPIGTSVETDSEGKRRLVLP